MITATSGEYLAWFNRGIHLLIAVQWDFDEVFVILSSLQFILFFFSIHAAGFPTYSSAIFRNIVLIYATQTMTGFVQFLVL